MSDRRALIVAAASPRQLREFADRPEILVAADSGLHAVLARGWIPDLVIGDLDSADPTAIAAAIDGGSVVEQARPDKDETDLELALVSAIDLGATDIHVVVRGDGRLDHQVANLAALASPTLAAVTVSANIGEHRVWIVRGQRSLDLPPGSHLALMPIGGPAEVSSRGVAFPLDHETLSPFAGRGIANEVTLSPVQLTTHDGVVVAISSPTHTNGFGDTPG